MRAKSFLAAIAVSGIFATFASGANGAKFTASQYPASISGKADIVHVLSFDGSIKVSCEAVKLGPAELTVAIPSITLALSYSPCAAIVGELPFEAKVNANGCGLELTVAAEEGGHDTYTGNAALLCPPGKGLEVTIFKSSNVVLCRYTIEAVESFGLVEYENLTPSPGRITAKLGSASYPYRRTAGVAAACGKEISSGKYTGAMTLEGGSEVSIDIS
jgi:hypothetical protein